MTAPVLLDPTKLVPGSFVAEAAAHPEALLYFLCNIGDGDAQVIALPAYGVPPKRQVNHPARMLGEDRRSRFPQPNSVALYSRRNGDIHQSDHALPSDRQASDVTGTVRASSLVA